jgi:hypothetical protein
LCVFSQSFFSLTSIFFSQITSVPSSNLTHKCTSSKVTGITFPFTLNILQASSSPASNQPEISFKAVSKIFQILFHQITHFSHSNLYSNNFLTNPVSSAKAAIHLLISQGGKTQYLSRICPVVPPESVIAIIAAKFFSWVVSIFFNQYKTLKVQLHQPITEIFNLSFIMIFYKKLFLSLLVL